MFGSAVKGDEVVLSDGGWSALLPTPWSGREVKEWWRSGANDLSSWCHAR